MSINKKQIAILLSNRGSNMQALSKAATQKDYPASIRLVISNKTGAKGLDLANTLGLNTLLIEQKKYSSSALYEKELLQALQAHQIDIICLAGYMSLLSANFIKHYPHRILNIHPSLLPEFRGLHAQQQALQAGAKITGCTVHIVTNEPDAGPIIAQTSVPVLKYDDVATLSERILEKEHELYPKALADFIRLYHAS